MRDERTPAPDGPVKAECRDRRIRRQEVFVGKAFSVKELQFKDSENPESKNRISKKMEDAARPSPDVATRR
jgi:hypothetical protein